MNHRLSRVAALAATAATGFAALTAASASADVPSFDRCPASADVVACVVAVSGDGSISADNHRLPLTGADVKVEGGLDNNLAFVAPTSGPALTAKPVTVPGGLFGRNLPYNLNTVKATVEQVGAVSYDYFTGQIVAPVRIKFTNPLLGANCAIGSAASPITLTLTAGVTSPAPPNVPIAGTPGNQTFPPGTYFAIEDQVQVDNTFAVPAATGCGIVAQAQVTKAINTNLGLPSAAGHYNDATFTFDHYIALPSA